MFYPYENCECFSHAFPTLFYAFPTLFYAFRTHFEINYFSLPRFFHAFFGIIFAAENVIWKCVENVKK